MSFGSFKSGGKKTSAGTIAQFNYYARSYF